MVDFGDSLHATGLLAVTHKDAQPDLTEIHETSSKEECQWKVDYDPFFCGGITK